MPAAAIFDLGEGPVLNVVRDGKSVALHPRSVTPHGGWVAVSGTDLKAGEPVIVEGGYNLPEDTPVEVRPRPRSPGRRPQAEAAAMSLTVEPERRGGVGGAAGSTWSRWPGRTSG